MLDHCDSMEEVKVVLQYSPTAVLQYSPGSQQNSNWHMALYAHHKGRVIEILKITSLIPGLVNDQSH